MENNREGELNQDEIGELDVYELVQHSMIRLKAQARMDFTLMMANDADRKE